MRRLAASILALAMLVGGAVPVFGAVEQGNLNEIKALYQEMYSIKAQIIDKQVEAKILDQAQAEKIKNAMLKRQQRIQQDIDKGAFHGFKPKEGCGHKSSKDSPAAQKTE